MSPSTQQQYRKMRDEKMLLVMDVALRHFAVNSVFRLFAAGLVRKNYFST
jgi:hypothetical protein